MRLTRTFSDVSLMTLEELESELKTMMLIINASDCSFPTFLKCDDRATELREEIGRVQHSILSGDNS